MAIRRPKHLRTRTIQRSGFGEPLQIIRVQGERERGQWVERESIPIETMGATAPASGSSSRVRELIESGGLRIEELREFWTIETLEPQIDGKSFGDILVFDSERYRVRSTGRWRGFSDSVAVRIEDQ